MINWPVTFVGRQVPVSHCTVHCIIWHMYYVCSIIWVVNNLYQLQYLLITRSYDLIWVPQLKGDAYFNLLCASLTCINYRLKIIFNIHVHVQCIVHRIHENGGRVENLGLSMRARHFRTGRIFVHRFLPSKGEPGISFSQRETEEIVSLLIMLSTLPPTSAMLLGILIGWHLFTRFKDVINIHALFGDLSNNEDTQDSRFIQKLSENLKLTLSLSLL